MLSFIRNFVCSMNHRKPAQMHKPASGSSVVNVKRGCTVFVLEYPL